MGEVRIMKIKLPWAKFRIHMLWSPRSMWKCYTGVTFYGPNDYTPRHRKEYTADVRAGRVWAYMGWKVRSC